LKEEPAWGSCAMRKEKSLDGEGDMMPLSHWRQCMCRGQDPESSWLCGGWKGRVYLAALPQDHTPHSFFFVPSCARGASASSPSPLSLSLNLWAQVVKDTSDFCLVKIP
jgi:hypothetical protein